MEHSYLLEHAQTAMVVIDNNMNVVEANAAYLQRNHLKKDDCIGKNCFKAAYNFSSACTSTDGKVCPLFETFETKKPSMRTHHYWVGEHAVIEEVSTSPIFNVQGEVEYVVEEFHDITALLGLKEGIISTCSYCKKIRDTDGKWVAFETYMHKHTGADFSHGICEECSISMFADLEKDKVSGAH